MASAFARLFSPSHRKSNSTSSTSSSRRQDSARNRFPTSSTFDLRHSIPEESSPAIEHTVTSLASNSNLTVQHLNHHVSAPISDAILRRRSLAVDDAAHSSASHAPQHGLARSFSDLDIRSPLLPGGDANHDLASTSQDRSAPVDDDDDFDSNPIYLQLSEDPQHINDWNSASLALVPLARTLTTHHAVHPDDLQDSHFAALHALAPSKLYKHQFVGVRSLNHSSSETHLSGQQGQYDWSHVTITATIEADQKSVCITQITHAPEPSSSTDTVPRGSSAIPSTTWTVKRTVSIVAETTIYRTIPSPSQNNAISSQTGFEVTSRAHPKNLDSSTRSAKVRVISVDQPIVTRQTHASTVPAPPAAQLDLDSSQDGNHVVSISELIHEHIPSKRQFGADLALLADPCVPSSLLSEALSNAFQVLFLAAHQFTASFVYVKGFDTYNAHRIRRGIWFKAWKAFEERLGSEQIARLSVEAFHRIKSLLENTVMGLVHTKMCGPIQDQLLDADLVTDEVLDAYNAFNVTLADFDVENTALKQRPGRLAAAIDALRHGLQDDGGSEADEALATGQVSKLRAALRLVGSKDYVSSPSVQDEYAHANAGLSGPHNQAAATESSQADLHRRTPLQILQAFRAVIDEIGRAAELPHPASSRGGPSASERPPPLGTDDLLPVLSWVFVRARPSRLCSMLYYARTFQLTDTATSPELQWALVTCDAVVTYLRTDPLHLCRRRSVSSVAAMPSRKGSQSHQGYVGAQHSASDTLSVRSMSARSHQAATAPSTIQATTPLARTPSATGSASIIEATPPLSPQSPPLYIDPPTDHLSSSGNTSGFFRHSDVSSDFITACEASPRLQAESFKLPGLPASRRNSRILQQRPTSVFSLSEDGDSISLFQDTSLEVGDRRSSFVAQSPSRRIGMRDRTNSSTSITQSDVQIRPQIVRTIKRSQTGNVYTNNRLERTSSNGSNGSSQIHVRVVGSPSIRAMESDLERAPSSVGTSPSKSDRRRSFDSWTAFSLFSTRGACSTDALAGVSDGLVQPTALSVGRRGSTNTTSAELSRAAFPSVTVEPAETTSSARPSLQVDRATSRHNSTSSRSTPRATPDHRGTTMNPESDPNCQPEGVETPRITLERAPSVRSSLRADGVQWPTSDAASSSRSGSLRTSQRRYRGRFLSSSSAAAPLPPQVDRTATSAELGPRTLRQSIGSLNALRATMNLDSGAMLPPVTALVSTDDVPEMIPYGGHPELAKQTPKIQLHRPSTAERRQALSEIDTNTPTQESYLHINTSS